MIEFIEGGVLEFEHAGVHEIDDGDDDVGLEVGRHDEDVVVHGAGVLQYVEVFAAGVQHQTVHLFCGETKTNCKKVDFHSYF